MSETLRDIAINHSESLVEKSQQGDNHAFGKLVGLWFKRIYNFTLRYFGNHDIAMEVTQRTFISVYDHLDSLKNIRSFKYWIYKIAINQCHEEDRRQKRRNWFSIFQHDEVKKIEEIHLNPEKEYHQKELEEIMNRLLKMIPEEQKVVIIMKEYERMKFREIAETLGISENTAKSRLYYGLNSLRKLIDKSGMNLEKFNTHG
jgi:RNA polymerase sigma factor (sigma-70 family)